MAWGAAVALLSTSAAAEFANSVFLNNGVQMPLLSLGTAEYKDTELKETIQTAVAAGFEAIDAAFNYYNQDSVRKVIQKYDREKLFVTTKTSPCYHPQAPPHYNISDVDACSSQTRKDVQADLDQLGLETVDLLLLHGANHFGEGGCDEASCALNRAQWQVYEEFLDSGRVKTLGVSNFCPSCLDCLLHIGSTVPAVNQIKLHVGMTADPEGIVSYSVAKGIVPMAYSPMGKGEIFSDPLMLDIASRHNKTAAQVALRWITQKGFLVATASHSPKHLAEDVEIFSWNLTSEEMSRIDAYSNSSDKPSWACTSSLAEDVFLV